MLKLYVYTYIRNILKSIKPKLTNMKKEEAQQRLNSIENEVKELRKIIEAPESKGIITDRIKTIEDAYKELGIKTYGDAYKALRMPEGKRFSDIPIDGCDDDGLNLMLFCRALNEGWWPDWKNTDEYKWYPYFDLSCSSGFGFSSSCYAYWLACTTCGSRLCFKSKALAEYAGKTITPTYKKFMTAV